MMSGHTNDQEIKRLIEQTVTTIQKNERDESIQIRKPQTPQGWIFVFGGLASAVTFFVSSILYLSDIADHAKEGNHKDTLDLIKTVNEKIDDHIVDAGLHFSDNDLKIKMIDQTEPLRRDINELKQDSKVMQKSLDFLVREAKERSE